MEYSEPDGLIENGYEPASDNEDLYSGHEESKTSISKSRKDRYTDILRIKPRKVETVDEEKYEAHLKNDIIEIVIALILFGIAALAYLYFKKHDQYFNPFDLKLMVIIAIVGIVASLLCTSYEGAFPGTLGGTILRATVLTIALDIPNVITIAVLIITYAFSIYYLYELYSGRIAGVILGTVAIICFPYVGIIVLLFIEMIMGGGSRRTNNKKK